MDTLAFSIELARKAGSLLMDFFASTNLATNLKPDLSVVTEADLACDQLISKQILDHYPNDVLLSEELQPDYLINNLSKPAVVWVVDPLDGTTNFSLGLHVWGVLITRFVNGWPEQTVQYFPVTNELFYAKLGQGAWLNEHPIHVEPASADRTTSFFACCSRTYQQYQVSIPYKPRIMGSAAYSFCCVARGAALIGFEATPKVWDISGAWLLIKEAGGFIETLDGSHPFPLRSDVDYRRQDFPTLAAANAKLANKARLQITPK